MNLNKIDMGFLPNSNKISQNLEPLTPRVPAKLLFHRLVHKLEGSMVLGVGPILRENPSLFAFNTVWPLLEGDPLLNKYSLATKEMMPTYAHYLT
jgi:hypothetical protein